MPSQIPKVPVKIHQQLTVVFLESLSSQPDKKQNQKISATSKCVAFSSTFPAFLLNGPFDLSYDVNHYCCVEDVKFVQVDFVPFIVTFRFRLCMKTLIASFFFSSSVFYIALVICSRLLAIKFLVANKKTLILEKYFVDLKNNHSSSHFSTD